MSEPVHPLIHKWQASWPLALLAKADLFKQEYRVRFHYFPGTQRYPQTEKDYEALLHSSNSLLTYLNPNKYLFIITAEWTDKPGVSSFEASERTIFDPAAEHLFTFDEDESEEDPIFKSYRQLYVSRRSWKPGAVDEILRGVADDKIDGVILAPQDLRWLYMPYDGGIDVVLSSPEMRDALVEKFRKWLPDE